MSYATLTVVDWFGRVAQQRLTAELVRPQERSDQRIRAVLDLVGALPTSDTELQPRVPLPALRVGSTILPAKTFPVETAVIEILREVAFGEGGVNTLFVRPALGGQFVFQPRDFVEASVVCVADVAEPCNEVTAAVPPVYGRNLELLTTEVVVTGASGTPQVRRNTEAGSKYGVRVLTRSTQLTDADAEALADWWLRVFSEPLLHVRRVKLTPHFEENALAFKVCVDVQPGRFVTVTVTPPGGQVVEQALVVDEVAGVVRPLVPGDTAQVDLTVSFLPPAVTQTWELGVSKLDTETVLASRRSAAVAGSAVAPWPGRPPRWPSAAPPGEGGVRVSAYRFQRVLAARVLTPYPTLQDLLADPLPEDGQVAWVQADEQMYLREAGRWRPVLQAR